MSVIKGTRLTVADNTGILIVECIGIAGGKPVARLGEVITVCAKKVTPSARKHWKNVHKAVIVRTVSRSSAGGMSSDKISFSDNAVVMIDGSGEPVGTRVFGPISRKVNKRSILSKGEVVL
jgi:large subunit ribosomal protein L14